MNTPGTPAPGNTPANSAPSPTPAPAPGGGIPDNTAGTPRGTPTSGGHPRRRWLRRVLIGIGILIVVLILLVLLAPTLLGTGPGKSMVLSIINGQIKGRVEIDSLSLGWFSGQSIKGLRLSDPAGNPVIDAAAIDAPQCTLWGLARGSLNFGNVDITKFKATIVQSPDGTLNLMSAIAMRNPSPPKPQSTPTDLSGLKLTLGLNNGVDVSYNAPKQEPLSIALGAAIRLEGLGLIELSGLHTDITRGKDHGAIDGGVTLRGLFNAANQPQPLDAQAEAELKLKDVPTQLVDGLANQGGKLVATLGPVLNGGLAIHGNLRDGTVALDANSANFVAIAHLTARDYVLTLTPTADAKTESRIHLTLVRDAYAAWTGTPGQAPATKLLQDVNLDVKFPQVIVPLHRQGDALTFSPAKAVADMSLDVTPVQIDAGPDVGIVKVSATKGSVRFNTTDLRNKLEAHLACSASYARTAADPERTGGLDLSANVADVLTADGQPNRTGMTANVGAHVTNWPTAIIDEAAHLDGIARAATGDILSIDLVSDLKPSADAQSVSGTVALNIKSDRLNGGIQGDISSKPIAADATPAKQYTLTLRPDQKLALHTTPELVAALVHRYAGAAETLKKLALGQPADITLTLGKLEAPMGGGSPLASLIAVAKLETTPLQFTGLPMGDKANQSAAIEGLTVNLSYDGPHGKVDASLDTDSEVPGLVAGKPHLGVTAHVTKLLDAKGQLDMAGATVDAGMTLDKLAYTANPGLAALQISNFKVTVPASSLGGTITVTMDADAYDGKQASKLHADTTLAKLLDAKGQFALPGATVKANVSIDQLAYSGDPRFAALQVSNLKITVPQSPLSGTVPIAVDADTSYNNQPGKIHADAKLVDTLGKAPQYAANATLDGLPVALVDVLANQNGMLTALLGDTIQKIDLHANPNPAAPRTLIFSAAIASDPQSQLATLSADVTGSFDATTQRVQLQLNPDKNAQPTAIKVTPQAVDRYNAWRQAHGVTTPGQRLLAASTTTVKNLQIDTVLATRVPAPAAAPAGPAAAKASAPAPDQPMMLPVDPARTKIALTIGNDTLTLVTPANDQVGANNLTLDVSIPSLTGETTIKLKADLQVGVAGAASVAGTIDSNTRISGIASADGQLTTKEIAFDTSTGVQKLPMALVDGLVTPAKWHGALVAAVGPLMDGTITAKYKPGVGGPCTISLDGKKNAKVVFPGTIDKNMVLTLQAGKDATLTLPADDPQLFVQLANINPVFGGIDSAAAPIQVSIDSKTFSVALSPFDLKKVVADVHMTIGTVKMSSSPLTGGVTTLLQKFLPGANANQSFTAILSPLTINVANGAAKTNDVWLVSTDMLSIGGSSPKLVALGAKVDTVDLITLNGTVRMGLPGIMLRQIPITSVRTAFDKDYIYEVVQTGPVSEIKPDYSALVGQIATAKGKAEALALAQQQLDRAPALARPLLQGTVNAAMDALLKSLPGNADQAEIHKRWPTPIPLPPGFKIDDAAAAPAPTPPPATPPPATPPANPPPRRPVLPIPLPKF